MSYTTENKPVDFLVVDSSAFIRRAPVKVHKTFKFKYFFQFLFSNVLVLKKKNKTKRT